MESPKAKAMYLCDVYNSLYQLESILAGINPTRYMRAKLKTESIFAEQVGKYVIIYPCYQVYSYKLITESGKCHNGVPISYKLRKNETEWNTGYLDPLYNNIMPSSINVDCHKKGTVFSAINGTISSHSPHGRTVKPVNVSIVYSLQHLPLTGIPLPDDYLNTDWIYNVSELAHTDISNEILNEIEKEVDELNNVNEDSSLDVKVKSKSKWWNIFGIFETYIFSGIHAIITWIERICVMILMWTVIIKGRIVNRRLGVRRNAAANV